MVDVAEVMKNTEDFMAEQAGVLAEAGAYGQSRFLLSLAEQIAKQRKNMTDGGSAAVSANGFAKSASKYPKFFLRHEQLVLQGLKQDGKGTYEHSVPKSHYSEIAEKIVKLSKDAHLTSKDLINDCALAYPYHVRTVLRYLKQRGLIRGRGSYTVTASDTVEVADKVRQAWEELPAEG